MVSMYYPNVNNITVIFWDLNNLKIINDTYGHEYGDKALSALASVLYAHSDEQCRRVYRFGGRAVCQRTLLSQHFLLFQ